jgi:hypothetical protein
MTRVQYTRCDQCGKTRDSREGWLHIYLLGEAQHRALVDAVLADASHGIDLCSWACARDYTMVQALDPAP